MGADDVQLEDALLLLSVELPFSATTHICSYLWFTSVTLLLSAFFCFYCFSHLMPFYFFLNENQLQFKCLCGGASKGRGRLHREVCH